MEINNDLIMIFIILIFSGFIVNSYIKETFVHSKIKCMVFISSNNQSNNVVNVIKSLKKNKDIKKNYYFGIYNNTKDTDICNHYGVKTFPTILINNKSYSINNISNYPELHNLLLSNIN